MYNKGYIIIASGGGGIPVVRERGQLKGIRAVIDKDRSAALLAKLVNADVLLILTDVDGVYLNYGKKSQKLLKSLSLAEAKKLLATGELQEGSMGPKVEAAIDFVSQAAKSRKIAVIANLHDIKKALQGKAGTVIMK